MDPHSYGFRSSEASSVFQGTEMARGSMVPTTPFGSSKTAQSTTMTPEAVNVMQSQPKNQNQNSRLFALLIAINTYNTNSEIVSENRNQAAEASSQDVFDLPVFTNLRGAVADGEHFYRYLNSALGVPEDRITFLYEDKATRSNIIKAFEKLADKTNGILPGDSIVIFYAGHGARAPPPLRLSRMKGWTSDLVELLIPYDINANNPDPELAKTCPKVQGIPDYTLAALVNNIAENKGDNITIIFDCCHSASALRGAPSAVSHNAGSEYITRSGPQQTTPLPDNLDEEIWGGKRGMTAYPRLRHLGAASYVFFSACAPSEQAKEKNARGCFTLALLTLLEEVGPRSLSCSQIISRLGTLEGQSPHCEGIRSSRFIFHGFAPVYRKKFINVQAAPNNGDSSLCTINAGSVNGLSKDDELTVYKSQSETDQKSHTGVLVIDQVFAKSSQAILLERTSSFALPAYALLTKPAKPHLRLFIDSKDEYARSTIKQLSTDHTVEVTSDPATAHISLSTTQSQLCFEVVDKDLDEIKFKRKYCVPKIDSKQIVKVLKGLSHYYWHLKRPSPLKLDDISVSFYELKEDPDDWDSQLIPVDEANDLNKEGIVTLKVPIGVDPEDLVPCGLKITNNTKTDFYPVLFYFDNTKFTIDAKYQHPTTDGQSDPPLKNRNSMTIGYGVVGAGAPSVFPLPKGYDFDIGFFKLIISTAPINLQDMIQTEDVFATERPRGAMEWRKKPSQAKWGSLTIKMVQEGVKK